MITIHTRRYDHSKMAQALCKIMPKNTCSGMHQTLENLGDIAKMVGANIPRNIEATTKIMVCSPRKKNINA